VLKDRLYTAGTDSIARRSAQTALAAIRDALLKLMAPILSFTAEEAWRTLHPQAATIFTELWKDTLPAVVHGEKLVPKWERILAVRAAVQKELETLRQSGAIGSSLQADVAITVPPEDYEALASLSNDLRFVSITSSATVAPGAELAVRVTPSTHAKCERCWHWRADVGADRAHPGLCSRCVANLFGAGEPRRFA
jgi:isoleucyl-tRNA synthetase